MRSVILWLGVFALAQIVWFVALTCIAEKAVGDIQGAGFGHADYPVCVTVKPAPLVKRKGPVLYPRNSETA